MRRLFLDFLEYFEGFLKFQEVIFGKTYINRFQNRKLWRGFK